MDIGVTVSGGVCCKSIEKFQSSEAFITGMQKQIFLRWKVPSKKDVTLTSEKTALTLVPTLTILSFPERKVLRTLN